MDAGDAAAHLCREGRVDMTKAQLILPHRAAGQEAQDEGIERGEVGQHFGHHARLHFARQLQPAHFAGAAFHRGVPVCRNAQLFERALDHQWPLRPVHFPHVARYAAGKRLEHHFARADQTGPAQRGNQVSLFRH